MLLDGKKVAEDKFNEEYVEHYKDYLRNKDYPILIGKTATGAEFYCTKMKTYAIRIYNKALTEEEAADNYEKTVAYREMLFNK